MAVSSHVELQRLVRAHKRKGRAFYSVKALFAGRHAGLRQIRAEVRYMSQVYASLIGGDDENAVRRRRLITTWALLELRNLRTQAAVALTTIAGSLAFFLYVTLRTIASVSWPGRVLVLVAIAAVIGIDRAVSRSLRYLGHRQRIPIPTRYLFAGITGEVVFILALSGWLSLSSSSILNIVGVTSADIQSTALLSVWLTLIACGSIAFVLVVILASRAAFTDWLQNPFCYGQCYSFMCICLNRL